MPHRHGSRIAITLLHAIIYDYFDDAVHLPNLASHAISAMDHLLLKRSCPR